jgi:hypothetical protein
MESFDNQFTDLDETPAAPTPASTPAAPSTGTTPAVTPTPAPKPAAAKPEEVDETFEGPAVATMKEVRGWGRRMADMAKHAQTKLKEVEAKLQDLEARGAVPSDVAKIQDDYKRLQTENAQLREAVKETDYSKDPEYIKTYREPYQQSYVRGRQAVANLTIREQDANGQMTSRPGTPDDFDKLYNMTDSDADIAAEAMFGPSARRVIMLRDAAKEKAEAAYNALQQASSTMGERKKQTEAQRAQQRLALRGLWKKVNEDLTSKHSKWFGTREKDSAWNEALAKGRQIAQQKFSAAYNQLAPEQRVILDAQIFNRAAAFTPMRQELSKLETQLAEAQKTIDQLRSSGPGKPQPGAAAGAEGEAKNWEEQFDKTVK